VIVTLENTFDHVLDGSLLVPSACHQIIDHSLKTEPSPVIRRVDSSNPIRSQFFTLLRKNRPSPTSEETDVLATGSIEELSQIAEELHVPALIGRDSNGVSILFYGCLSDLGRTAIVAEMDHLCTGRLKDPSHDVDGGVMSVKERCRGYKTNLW
jgi:hypothetical protein